MSETFSHNSAPATTHAETLPAIHSKAERVLIVDDEPIIRDILSKVVSSEGYFWGIASNGQEAIDRLLSSDYQIVLTDVRMPSVDGLALLQHVTANHPTVAVIMITAMNDARSAVEALSMGAYDYVTKPFNIFELRSKIGRAAERRRLIMGNQEYQSFLEERVEQQTADIKEALVRIDTAYSHTLEALISALDAREHETLRHSKRVSEYTLLIARALGIPRTELVDIGRGSLLHDIGKIGISDNILLKPARLTEEEWTEIRKHPDIGYSIINKIDFLAGAAEMVLQHHERFDGTGYPQKLKGDQILLAARIFALVDTFDAMTSDRPYRKALTYQDARNEISRCCGTQFDPEIVKCFMEIPEQVWSTIKAQVR
jgi:putative nucleotidyltransferase with HDIG domain